MFPSNKKKKTNRKVNEWTVDSNKWTSLTGSNFRKKFFERKFISGNFFFGCVAYLRVTCGRKVISISLAGSPAPSGPLSHHLANQKCVGSERIRFQSPAPSLDGIRQTNLNEKSKGPECLWRFYERQRIWGEKRGKWKWMAFSLIRLRRVMLTQFTPFLWKNLSRKWFFFKS